MATNPASHERLSTLGYVGDAGTAEAWLGVAWRALVAEVPDLEARMDAGEVGAESVADVVTSATLRVLRNPEGYESESESLDDYSSSFKRADSTRDVYFTAAELRRLTGLSPATAGWSGSLPYCR